MKKLLGLFRRRPSEPVLANEMREHLEELIDSLMESGLTREQAEIAARRRFGNRTSAMEASRDEWILPVLADFLQDLRYAVRTLRKSPLFIIAVVLPLALGIGANTAIFTVVQAALLRSLPYRDPAGLMHLWESNPGNRSPKRQASYPDFEDWSRAHRFFDGVAGYQAVGLAFTLTGGAQTEQLSGVRTSANFFAVLGVQPVFGRAFEVGEDRPGGPRVVLLSDGLWRRRFAADAGIVGRPIVLNGASFTVIGILPPAFAFAPAGPADLWLPLVPSAQQRERRYSHWMYAIARLKPGATAQQGNAELASIGEGIARLDPKFHTGSGVWLAPLQEEVLGQVRPVLLVLMGTIGLVLLLACANVANLVLVRGASRQKEMALRGSLGAGRARLARQLLTECLLLAAIGGALGVAVAHAGVSVLTSSIPAAIRAGMPYLEGLAVDSRMLIFTAAVSIATGLAFGLLPALRLSRGALYESLKSGGRTSAEGAHHGLRRALLIAEVAISLVLLTGAGLMMKSTRRLLEVDPGFRADHLVTMRVGLASAAYREPAQATAFHESLLERLRALPGITGADTVSVVPLAGGGNTGTLRVNDRPETPNSPGPDVNVRTVSAGYFQTMGIPLVAGRHLTDRDNPSSPRVVLINRRLAKEIFPNENPLGRQVSFVWSPGPWQIVGIVADENTVGLASAIRPVLYFPYLQDSGGFGNLMVRFTGSPAAVAESVRREVRALDPEVPVFAVRSMDQVIAEAPSTFMRRYPAFLIGVFAAIALVLAALGTYGLVAYAAAQHTREIGIRIALGAQPRDVLRLVMGEGLRLIVAGLMCGLIAAGFLARTLETLLFGVKPWDPPTYLAVSVVLATAALLASYLPARRALRVPPGRILGAE